MLKLSTAPLSRGLICSKTSVLQTCPCIQHDLWLCPFKFKVASFLFPLSTLLDISFIEPGFYFKLKTSKTLSRHILLETKEESVIRRIQQGHLMHGHKFTILASLYYFINLSWYLLVTDTSRENLFLSYGAQLSPRYHQLPIILVISFNDIELFKLKHILHSRCQSGCLPF